jgi:hypothetical protein
MFQPLYLLAEGGGFEPPPTDSESAVLPLNYPSKLKYSISARLCHEIAQWQQSQPPGISLVLARLIRPLVLYR